ncbi:MAG: TlpA disulfide reductase family protein [Bacteroidales bacterium]|nr:TlpA family protein disulfide reductase [Bacteroidales bacterium]MDD2425747.1 TlpA disulfide reductase family protein [Bacteroidales bacterium]MDD3989527.1 TlpA disulfide reductase family protein [Bacteroidales bacterium]MDD4639071.1 TlpA disulfide reductase family protein [Bacteroidales bacterium]
MKKLILFVLLISNSAWAQQQTQTKYNLEDFNLIVKVEDQEKYYNDMLEAASRDNTKPARQDEYLITLATGWLAKGNLEKYRYYMKSNPEISFVSLYNLVHTLEYLENDDKYMNVVEQASGDIIDKIEKDAGNDNLTRGRLQVLLEINAMANAKLGKVDAANKSIEKASAIKGDRDLKYYRDSKANYYKRYSTVLSASGEHKKALDTLTKTVRNADSNPGLLATLRDVYIKVYGSDKGCDKFIGTLQEEAYNKCYKEVEKSYLTDVNMPFKGSIADPNDTDKQLAIFTARQHAHDISLPDLNGKMVNFADYKGKILVIDFWTTLCTPCVAAFAGFERVAAYYKNEPFQLFVIDLFEPQQNVKSFIAKKGITLDVLRDEPNESYDIQATPTKIIFDPMGNIRFYSCGYAGSTDREYYKLKAMVEIVKARVKGK